MSGADGLCLIRGSIMAVLWMEGWGDDVFTVVIWWSVRYSGAGLRVSVG